MSQHTDNEQQLFQEARPELHQVPLVYANGFEMQVSLSDLGVLLMADGQPAIRLKMSFTTAKTLIENLARAVGDIERATGQEIMTMETVQAGLSKLVSQ